MKAKKVFALFCAIAMVTGTAVTVPLRQLMVRRL